MTGQSERLKSIIKLYNSSMVAFEKKSGLSNGAISMPIRKGIDFSTATISKICLKYPINEYWLFSGQGNVFKEELSLPEHIVKILYELGIDFCTFETQYGLLPGTVISVLDDHEKEEKYNLLDWAQYLNNYAQDNNIVLDFSWIEDYERENEYLDYYPRYDEEQIKIMQEIEAERYLDAIEGKKYVNPITKTPLHPKKKREIAASSLLRLFKEGDFEYEILDASLSPQTTFCDIAICKDADISKEIQWNNVYYIETARSAFVRIVKPDDNPDNIRCVARNEDYDPIIIPRADIIKAAIVIGVIKRMA